MSNLEFRQSKIKEKRRFTVWRDFLRDIASRQPVNFYRKNKMISRYPDSPRIKEVIPVVDFEDYIANKAFAEREIGEDFFETLEGLFRDIPLPNLHQEIDSENSQYTDSSGDIKNAYLSFICSGGENILYSFSTKTNINNVISSLAVWTNCDNVFQSVYITNSSNIFYSKNIHNSYNIRFSINLVGCQYCIGCSGLENQSYCIDNTPYSQDEYELLAKQILSQNNTFEDRYEKLQNSMTNINVINSKGRGLLSTLDVEDGVICANVNCGHNIMFCGGASTKTNYFDAFCAGKGDDSYGVVHAANSTNNIYCSAFIYNSSSIFYSYYIVGCSFCLGCIGLKNKSYCIFNKQYTKEERNEKINEIFQKMECDGSLGQFFPATMNPFYFNDTAAYLIDSSFTKEEVTKLGYLWRDDIVKVDIPVFMDIVKTKDLTKFEGHDKDGQWIIDASILKKVIVDESGDSYRIIKMEYDFLLKYGLPLPRKHRIERMKDNFRIS